VHIIIWYIHHTLKENNAVSNKSDGSTKNLSVTVTPHKNTEFEHKQQVWEDLEDIFQSIRDALLELVHALQRFLNDDELRRLLSANPENVILIRGFEADANGFASALGNIHKQHEHLTGPVDDNDVVKQLTIFGEYVELKHHMDELMLPTFSGITTAILQVTNKQESTK
jgi:hypothetical protein